MTGRAFAITDVTKRYGRVTALDDVSLALGPGERLALLGHNGAGKTTLIKLILGLSRPDAGTIEILGRRPISKAVRREWAYLPENVAFHKSLTGREQLTMFARLKGEPLRQRDRNPRAGRARRRDGQANRNLLERDAPTAGSCPGAHRQAEKS